MGGMVMTCLLCDCMIESMRMSSDLCRGYVFPKELTSLSQLVRGSVLLTGHFLKNRSCPAQHFFKKISFFFLLCTSDFGTVGFVVEWVVCGKLGGCGGAGLVLLGTCPLLLEENLSFVLVLWEMTELQYKIYVEESLEVICGKRSS